MGCTWVAYQKAKADAVALCKVLGPGWKPRLWENLGWHYEASHYQMRVTYSKFGKVYTAWFNAIHQEIADAKSPRAAVEKAIAQMHAYVGTLLSSLRKVSHCHEPLFAPLIVEVIRRQGKNPAKRRSS